MNLLVFSDTHHYPERMLRIVGGEPHLTACFHLGDGWDDAELLQQRFPAIPVYSVAGNCDRFPFAPREGLAPFGGMLFFYTHGNTYHVKHGPGQLWLAAKQRGATAALYGHTHTPFYEITDGIHIFNPGSLSFPRSGPPTFGRITIAQQTPTFSICPYAE